MVDYRAIQPDSCLYRGRECLHPGTVSSWLASDTWISFGLLLMLTSCYLVKYKIPKFIPRCVKTVQSDSLYNVRVAVGELGSFYLLTAHFWFQLWCFLVLQLFWTMSVRIKAVHLSSSQALICFGLNYKEFSS